MPEVTPWHTHAGCPAVWAEGLEIIGHPTPSRICPAQGLVSSVGHSWPSWQLSLGLSIPGAWPTHLTVSWAPAEVPNVSP